MAYQPGIPTGSVPLNQDYLNIQGNFTSLNTQFNEDHVPLTSTSGTPPNGYHTSVHLVPFSTTTTNPPNNQPVVTPTATPGYGIVFDAQINDGINTDTALYFLSGGNRLTQLTRNIQPSATANGFTSLPGGLLMAWGNALTGATVNYGVTFTTVFSIQVTPTTDPLGLGPLPSVATPLSVSAVTTTTFTAGNNTGQLRRYYWTAIGI